MDEELPRRFPNGGQIWGHYQPLRPALLVTSRVVCVLVLTAREKVAVSPFKPHESLLICFIALVLHYIIKRA